MQSTTRIRIATFALVLASAAPTAVFAGHEQFVQQHRLMRAELSGVAYLPGDVDVVLAAGAAVSPDPAAMIITASHGCSDSAIHTCEANTTNP